MGNHLARGMIVGDECLQQNPAYFRTFPFKFFRSKHNEDFLVVAFGSSGMCHVDHMAGPHFDFLVVYSPSGYSF